MTELVRVTYDRKGFAFWPDGVNLRFDGEEWYDRECKVRGSSYLPFLDDASNGDNLLLKIEVVERGNGAADADREYTPPPSCCFCGMIDSYVRKASTGTPMHLGCLRGAGLGSLEAELFRAKAV
jgi:hypothetical protein